MDLDEFLEVLVPWLTLLPSFKTCSTVDEHVWRQGDKTVAATDPELVLRRAVLPTLARAEARPGLFSSATAAWA